ncbi:hypothetical protein LWI28_014973 [Acer negundo]|uniref:Mediator complex subunit 15 KIX domain-containing protein n=1 Tax=Acer negundo TaxID=4023 RepID=A0AAD5JDG2_ACENE|nr:hypothetical protein LWI28_014973 [Acer negundo]
MGQSNAANMVPGQQQLMSQIQSLPAQLQQQLGLQQQPNMETPDWRTQLQPDSRQRIVNKIMDTLKRHLPFSGPEGLNELKKIAERFEEKIYTAATDQSDYLRRISLKMLSMESKSQTTMSNPLQPNSGGTSNKPLDPAVESNFEAFEKENDNE